MGIITALAITAVAVTAAGVYSAQARKAAASKAASAQNKALNKSEKILQNELGYSKVNDAYLRAERARLENRKSLQEQFDPELARLRQLGAEQVVAEAEKPAASLDSSKVVQQVLSENLNEDPRLKALRDNLLTRGLAESTAGATLAPETQAELVRAGLAAGGGSGIGTGKAQVGGSVARLLGESGLALQAKRDAAAQQIAGTVQNLDVSRASILQSIFPTVTAQEANLRARGATNLVFADQMAPAGGLTGSEGANLQIQRGQTLIALKQKKGQVAAQKAIAGGEAKAAIAGAIASGVSTAAGGYASYAGGAGGAGGAGTQMLGVGGTGAQVDIGNYGSRTPTQQSNFNFLQSYYE